MDREELYRLKALLKRSSIRKRILELLLDEPLTPTDIGKELEVAQPNISQRLADLKEENLVEVLNPEDHRDRFYAITDKGKKLMSSLNQE